MEKEITLVQAIFGMGNQNHDHVHRNNSLHLNSMAIDTLKMEQFSGGIKATTMNQIAAQSGGLTAQPQGMVSIEDGFNIRRGIGLLRFHVYANAVESVELSVLGYLTGGGATIEGIMPDTMFVPVRSWSVSTTQKQDHLGLPMAATAITSSSQFLLGDPFLGKQLKASRPMDVANEALGFMACLEDGTPVDHYDGTLGTDLNKTVVVSKTQNLNPTHHARELLKVAAQTTALSSSIGLENAFADSLAGPGIHEMPLSENDFMKTMMWSLGSQHMLNGFQGFTVRELNQVFVNFSEVLNLDLLQETSFSKVNNVMDSDNYGSVTDHEIIASELAFMTVHILMQVGLTHLHFSATNNPHDFAGIVLSQTGVGWAIGSFGSVLNHDNAAQQRVEDFKTLMEMQFFSKYSTGYIHNSTIMSVEVDCSVFGETSVTIFFNGDQTVTKRFVNATYCINRTSTNIAASQAGMAEAQNFMKNIHEHFSS